MVDTTCSWKQPSFQFYPGDWVQDTRCLSLAAKGAWIDLLCAMHRSQTRGVLALPIVGYARLIGATVEQTEAVITELTDMRICDREYHDGAVVLINRRMVREERQRDLWRQQKRDQRSAAVSAEHDAQGSDQDLVREMSAHDSTLREQRKALKTQPVAECPPNVRSNVRAMSAQCPPVSSSSSSLLIQETANAVSFSAPESGAPKPPPSGNQHWPKEDLWILDLISDPKLLPLSAQITDRLKDHEWWERTAEACNGLDPQFLRRELAKMANWLTDNPQRRPTARGIRRFVANWLIRAYEQERRYARAT